MTTLRTARLQLRPWREDDLEPFAALNADPEVMEHFAAPIGRADSDAFARRAGVGFAERGWGLWAVEVSGGAPFIGYVGLLEHTFEAHFTPAIEVGWRLARAHWGQGYATEGGRAALAYAFDELGLREIVSITTVANERSRRVMERLGMTHDVAGDFEHPALPPGHRVRPHVLYRLDRETWRNPP